MDKLISDGARVEISKEVNEILRALVIDSWQSEREHQHQNFAEHRYRHFKRNHNWTINTTNDKCSTLSDNLGDKQASSATNFNMRNAPDWTDTSQM